MNIDDAKTTLRTALREAMRARDSALTSLWREVLAALENAEAPALSSSSSALSALDAASPIAGAVSGAGAGEVARLELSADDVAMIIAREVEERRSAATSYAALARATEAALLDRQVKALEALFAA